MTSIPLLMASALLYLFTIHTACQASGLDAPHVAGVPHFPLFLPCPFTSSSFALFYFSLLGRVLRVDVIKLVSNVRPYVRPSVRLSTKSSFDFSEFWYVGRGRWVMHNGMQYDSNQGQGHELLEVWNLTIFKGYLLPHLQWGLANDHGFLN